MFLELARVCHVEAQSRSVWRRFDMYVMVVSNLVNTMPGLKL